jgi:hypothetical protein
MLNEMLINVIKASNKSQCPLDLFITHIHNLRFKQEIIAFTVTQI